MSVEEDSRQEWTFTLYDFDNNGKVTREVSAPAWPWPLAVSWAQGRWSCTWLLLRPLMRGPVLKGEWGQKWCRVRVWWKQGFWDLLWELEGRPGEWEEVTKRKGFGAPTESCAASSSGAQSSGCAGAGGHTKAPP